MTMAASSRAQLPVSSRAGLLGLLGLAVLAVSAHAAVQPGSGAASPAGAERLAPRTGRYLVATRQVRGPIFGRSVVLLLEASDKGAAGLVVNRPTELSLREVFPEFAALAQREDRVHLGGPLEPRGLLFVVRTEKPPDGSSPLVDDLHIGRSVDALYEVIERGVPRERFRSFVGYAGWAPGQLEHEIERGDWYVIEGNISLVFREGGEDIWRDLLLSLEAIRVRAPSGRAADSSPRSFYAPTIAAAFPSCMNGRSRPHLEMSAAACSSGSPWALWCARSFRSGAGLARRFYIRWVPSVRVMKRMGRIHTWLFLKTGGLIGSRADGLDMLLLTVRGRKSGLPRTQPLPYFRDPAHPDERLVLIASFGGNERDPHWCYNLDMHPQVTVQLKRRHWQGSATRATGEERARLWRQITSEHPRYLAYQERTPREIPVVVIELSTPRIEALSPQS